MAREAALAATCANHLGKSEQYHDAVFRKADELKPLLLSTLARDMGIDSLTFANCRTASTTIAEWDADTAIASRNNIQATPVVLIDLLLFVGKPNGLQKMVRDQINAARRTARSSSLEVARP